jgi:hypothetical protein
MQRIAKANVQRVPDAVLADLYRRRELVDELIRGLEDYASTGEEPVQVVRAAH